MQVLAYLLIGLLLLAVILVPEIYSNNSLVSTFLNDNINLALLFILIVLVAQFNKVVSVMLLLLLVIMVVNVRNKSLAFTNSSNNTMHTAVIKIDQDELNSMASNLLNPKEIKSLKQQQTGFQATDEMMPSEIMQPMTSASSIVKEGFIRDTLPVYPTKSQSPQDAANLNYDTKEAFIEKFNCTSLPLNDLPTQQMLKAVDGYDIEGCRYDSSNCAQNTTRWGSPLADCNTYDAKLAKEVGAVFYPLNA